MDADDPKPELPSLDERILDVFDPDGSLRSSIEGMQALVEHPEIRELLRQRGPDVEAIASVVESTKETLASISGSMRLAALGWAPSGLTPMTATKDAVTALDGEGGAEEADRILVEAWNSGLLAGAININQVGLLGKPSEEYNALFLQRRRLLFKAWQHHRAGAYEASVPIVYAQIEGICFDVTGKPFFNRKRGASAVDGRSLAGLDEALPTARKWFSHTADETVADGGPSRHGVLHGRELAYDTRVVSTKALVLLLAVIEWARPIAADLGEWFEALRTAEHLGSDEKDDDGRWMDRREFPETTASLDWLCQCQHGRYLRQGGRFQLELLDFCAPRFRREGLPDDHGISMEVTDDGQAWWAWRRTEPGLVFAIGQTARVEGGRYGDGNVHQWKYEGAEPPAGPPGEDPAWGDDPHEWPPNWR